jgi:hypothetical protein
LFSAGSAKQTVSAKGLSKGADPMKEVLEKLFQQIPVGPTEPMEKLKQELFAAAEQGPENIQDYFARAGQSLLEEAKTLVQRLRSKIGDS